jgi:hypothetical protein
MMNWKLGFAGVALAALMVACPGGGTDTTKPKINSFTGKAFNSTDPAGTSVNLPAGGGQVTFAWDVTNGDTLTIDKSVGAITGATGTKTVSVTETGTYTLTAAKTGGGTSNAQVSVNVAAGITVNGTVKSFNGDPAVGVTVQIGDASAPNRVQVQTDGAGKFEAKGVTTPYTITAIPASLADEVPVSYKGVNAPAPIVVLEPQTGKAKPCNKAEAYVRFRLNGGSFVQDNNVGYMYFVADNIHEDELKSNAVTLLRPGERGGLVRVLMSNNTCKTSVTGSLVYLERGQNGYSFAGIQSDVEAITGTATPSGDKPYLVTIAGTGSRQVSGKITLPVGYEDGFVFPVLKVGKASVIVSDPRDISQVNKLSQTGNSYGFNLPPAIAGVEYRIGAFVQGPSHFAWYFSDNISPLPDAGKIIDITTSNTFQGQEPAGNILDNVTPVFAWTATNPANLYYIGFGNINCNEAQWTAVSTGATSSELTSFQLPRLPQPARMDVGTIQQPCRYNWAAGNAIQVRDAPVTADKMLDGRLVLKRHYNRTAFSSFNFFAVAPINVPEAAVSAPTTTVPTDTDTVYRPELEAFLSGAAAPVDVPKTTDTNSLLPGTDVTALLIPSADRAKITTFYSTQFVGAFNNPDEIASGVISFKSQEYQTQK